ncbi:MAG: translation initiation factor IF-2 N-terminal domain-containing protein, partial [Burkholderiales bacterium]|nr:translation initiation factor IF-2 N-terminal domain-containing protein [Burkholderiales bacterium]
MAQTSVAQFAGELKVAPSVLLEQLRAAGVNKSMADDILSEQDKAKLLDYLRRVHGGGESKNKITLTRKQTSEIKKADASGKSRTIQVEVRKKRVFVKRDIADTVPVEVQEKAPAAAPQAAPAAEAAPAAAPETAPAATPAPQTSPAAPAARPSVLDPKEIELREAEQRRMEELAARQAAELAEKQERERRLAELREAEQRAAEEQARQAQQQPAQQAPGATTLHKPKTTAADKDKKAKKAAKTVTVWKEESAAAKKRGGLKTRGDSAGVSGWHGAKAGSRHSRGGEAQQQQFSAPAEPIVREVQVPETITVADLAHKMSVKAAEVIKTLMKLGQMVT